MNLLTHGILRKSLVALISAKAKALVKAKSPTFKKSHRVTPFNRKRT